MWVPLCSHAGAIGSSIGKLGPLLLSVLGTRLYTCVHRGPACLRLLTEQMELFGCKSPDLLVLIHPY